MRSQDRLSMVAHYTLLVILVTYLFAPSKQMIVEGMHRLSHTLSNPVGASHHSHRHDAGSPQDHHHSVLEILSTLTDSEENAAHESLYAFSFLDKHLPQPQFTYIVPVFYHSHSFVYLAGTFQAYLPTPYPPPKDTTSFPA